VGRCPLVGEPSSLRVCDDRRDRFVQVSVERHLTADDLKDRSLTVVNGHLVVPLSAVVEAGGGSQGEVLARRFLP
jgi:hypothetical protein